jgi:hypothetical protein
VPSSWIGDERKRNCLPQSNRLIDPRQQAIEWRGRDKADDMVARPKSEPADDLLGNLRPHRHEYEIGSVEDILVAQSDRHVLVRLCEAGGDACATR